MTKAELIAENTRLFEITERQTKTIMALHRRFNSLLIQRGATIELDEKKVAAFLLKYGVMTEESAADAITTVKGMVHEGQEWLFPALFSYIVYSTRSGTYLTEREHLLAAFRDSLVTIRAATGVDDGIRASKEEFWPSERLEPEVVDEMFMELQEDVFNAFYDDVPEGSTPSRVKGIRVRIQIVGEPNGS